MTPARKLFTTTSAPAHERVDDLPRALVRRSSATLRLLRLRLRRSGCRDPRRLDGPPGEVALSRALDLDDVGAEVGEHLGAHGPSMTWVKSMTRTAGERKVVALASCGLVSTGRAASARRHGAGLVARVGTLRAQLSSGASRRRPRAPALRRRAPSPRRSPAASPIAMHGGISREIFCAGERRRVVPSRDQQLLDLFGHQRAIGV